MPEAPSPLLRSIRETAEDFDALERARMRGTQVKVLYMCLAACVIMLLEGFVVRSLWSIGLCAIGGGLFLVAYWLLMSGRSRVAAFFTALVPLGMVTLTAATGGGLHDLTVAAFAAIILYAGMTLTRRTYLMFFLLLVGATFFIVLNQQYAWLPLREARDPGWVELLIAVLIMTVTASAVMMLAADARSGLEMAHSEIRRRRDAELELAELSSHDALTGLYSRRYFEDEIQRMERTRHYPVSVIMADVDGLKRVNDTLGHAEGDRLLVTTARILGSLVRAEDVLARIGGDEFAILLPEANAATAQEALGRVVQSLQSHQRDVDGTRVRLSLGVATAQAGGLRDAIKLADTRMYEHKALRKASPDQEWTP